MSKLTSENIRYLKQIYSYCKINNIRILSLKKDRSNALTIYTNQGSLATNLRSDQLITGEIQLQISDILQTGSLSNEFKVSFLRNLKRIR